jgi:hypothetical protein
MYGRRYHNRDTSDQTLLVGIIAALLVMFMAGFFYNTHKRRINGFFVQYISVQLAAIAPFSDHAATIKGNLNATDPEDISMADIWALAGYAGKRLRWVVLPLTLILAYLVYFSFGRVEQFKRKFTMEALLKNNIKLFPEIAPIVNRPNPITEEPLDSGPWRTARTPLQFALENGLIIDQNRKPVPINKMIGVDGLPLADATILRLEKGLFLDLPRAEHVFVSQLGDVFEGPDKLKPHQKAFAAALLAYAHSDRKAGIEMLNQLSMSFLETPPKSSKDVFTIDMSGADALLEKYSADHRELNRHASYTNCWMSALLEFARGKGVIACSMFIWLRPIDRTLWYALNQCGRRVAWPEAAGVRAHMQAEEEKAHMINTPEVEGAVLSLEQHLIEAGHLFMGSSMEERMHEN